MRSTLVLLAAHFVGDFLCQTDWMALNKSKRWDALAAHVAVYALVLIVTIGFFATPGYPPLIWVAVNALAHFVTDAITSRITSRLWFLKMTPAVKGWRVLEGNASTGVSREETAYWMDDLGTRHWFFVAIGADQLIHYVTLVVTASWWLR